VRSALAILILAGCQASSGPAQDECPASPFFTTLPVDESAVAWTTVIGGFSPPAHTLPSDHGGLYLAGQGLTLRAPGPLTLLGVRRTRYLRSAFRTGNEDHALDLAVCGAVRVTLGHVVTLAPALAALIQPGGCQTYSTANETVETCSTPVSRPVLAGEVLGTVGGETALAFDFGLYDRRHRNAFANPARFEGQMTQALCPWESFTEGPRAFLLAHVGQGTQRRMAEPACGTMEVDRPGTAQGMWIEESRAGVRTVGDESPYVTLTYDVVHPADQLLFAVGVPALGPGAYLGALEHEGARQRAFGEVLPDGALHCYEVRPGVFRPAGSPRVSFLLSLDGARLRLEKREDATACDGEPAGWSFGSGALAFVR
jgi:hypothetical protein